MTEKLTGGAIVSNNYGAHGVVQLLTLYNRAQMDLVYFSHPYDVDVNAGFDFLIVLTVQDFEGIVKFYDAKQRQVPLLVHIDSIGVLENYDHARAYPGIDVLAIKQAPLDGNLDVTLEVNLFGKIIKRLRDQP